MNKKFNFFSRADVALTWCGDNSGTMWWLMRTPHVTQCTCALVCAFVCACVINESKHPFLDFC